jgi:hypothetical protein
MHLTMFARMSFRGWAWHVGLHPVSLLGSVPHRVTQACSPTVHQPELLTKPLSSLWAQYFTHNRTVETGTVEAHILYRDFP